MGRILLVHIIEDNEKNPRIHLVESDADMAYDAISHVFSGGLGNLQENSIPWYQLIQLSELIQSLSEEFSNAVLF